MTRPSVVTSAAFVALTLGLLAAFAGSPRKAPGDIDASTIAREVEAEADHVTAIELARWIRDRKPNLRVIDIRDSAAFEEYHLPLAERRSIEDAAATDFKPSETVVLYSGGGAHAAQVWVLLRARGARNVFFLRGGLDEWLSEVMNPRLPATPSASEKLVVDSVIALSKYFGGVPRVVDSQVPLETWKGSVAKIRGRGC